ncbi:DNA polymerase III subunit alpha, partial [Escherichia coli]|nr:DNA polymerase III subunit alpha [Escherichia coli]
LPNERLAEEHKAIGFYLSGHPLDDYMAALKRKRVMTLEEVAHKAQAGPFIAKLAGSVAGRQERKSARGNRFAFAQLSDPTGLYEITIFSDVLETAREHLETGANVVLTVKAELESDQLKLLAQSVRPVDDEIADAGDMGLKVFIDAPEAVPAVAGVLERAKAEIRSRGRGPVQFCLMAPDLPGEVSLDLPEPFPVNPQIKSAIKSLPGVVLVEEI